jgi:hypothetical protein
MLTSQTIAAVVNLVDFHCNQINFLTPCIQSSLGKNYTYTQTCGGLGSEFRISLLQQIYQFTC